MSHAFKHERSHLQVIKSERTVICPHVFVSHHSLLMLVLHVETVLFNYSQHQIPCGTSADGAQTDGLHFRSTFSLWTSQIGMTALEQNEMTFLTFFRAKKKAVGCLGILPFTSVSASGC